MWKTLVNREAGYIISPIVKDKQSIINMQILAILILSSSITKSLDTLLNIGLYNACAINHKNNINKNISKIPKTFIITCLKIFQKLIVQIITDQLLDQKLNFLLVILLYHN